MQDLHQCPPPDAMVSSSECGAYAHIATNLISQQNSIYAGAHGLSEQLTHNIAKWSNLERKSFFIACGIYEEKSMCVITC